MTSEPRFSQNRQGSSPGVLIERVRLQRGERRMVRPHRGGGFQKKNTRGAVPKVEDEVPAPGAPAMARLRFHSEVGPLAMAQGTHTTWGVWLGPNFTAPSPSATLPPDCSDLSGQLILGRMPEPSAALKKTSSFVSSSKQKPLMRSRLPGAHAILCDPCIGQRAKPGTPP